MVEQRKRISRGWNGRFDGFRVNCEVVPMLPAWAVRCVWDDPRRIPYLLVWTRCRDGTVKEAVRVVRVIPSPGVTEAPSVEVKRTDGSAVHVNLVWRQLPRGGHSLLLRCWSCQKPSRALYSTGVGDDGRSHVVRRAHWECRMCARLHYSSEGGALLIRWGLTMSRFPRPRPWLPLVFSSLTEAVAAGLCSLA